ncbi:hypothetical protein GF385_03410 [Candidatus Dependentiae bacterium]|nr:hypothetical protein [Candidatus Dependentiae bacterium]
MRAFSFIFLLIFPFYLNSIVILTHGAFGDTDNWYEKGGYFYDALSDSGKILDKEIITFKWEQYLGGITHHERLSAGKALAEFIADKVSGGEKEIILIGHSYGGHVIKLASQILAIGLDLQDMDRPVIIPENNKKFLDLDENFFKSICSEFKNSSSLKKLKKFLSKRNSAEKLDNIDKFIIDQVYTLATPNDIPDYFSNMNVIGFLYNYFSKGDLVQDFVGDRELPQPKHERAVNLEVRMKGSGWFGLWGKPNHIEMHAEIIAKWILYIPLFLSKEKIGNFDKFNFDYNGQVKFSPKKPPVYICNAIGLKDFNFFSNYDLEWLKNKMQFIRNFC